MYGELVIRDIFIIFLSNIYYCVGTKMVSRLLVFMKILRLKMRIALLSDSNNKAELGRIWRISGGGGHTF